MHTADTPQGKTIIHFTCTATSVNGHVDDSGFFFLRWSKIYFVCWWLISTVMWVNLFVALILEVSSLSQHRQIHAFMAWHQIMTTNKVKCGFASVHKVYKPASIFRSRNFAECIEGSDFQTRLFVPHRVFLLLAGVRRKIY